MVVEEDNEPAVKKQSDRRQAEENMKSPPSPEQSKRSIPEHKEPEQEGEGEGDESDDEDEEEDYDIDE